jgi:hypothetical protein
MATTDSLAYEHKILTYREHSGAATPSQYTTPESFETALNSQGADGWAITSTAVVPSDTGGATLLFAFLSRVKPQVSSDLMFGS